MLFEVSQSEETYGLMSFVFFDVVRPKAAGCSVLLAANKTLEPLVRCMYSLVSSQLRCKLSLKLLMD